MTTHPEQLTPHGHVLRYTLKERLTHWVAAGSYLYLLATGLAVLVAVVVLAGLGAGRGTNFADAASMGGPYFRGRSHRHVRDVVAADGIYGRGPCVVEVTALLHHQPG